MIIFTIIIIISVGITTTSILEKKINLLNKKLDDMNIILWKLKGWL